MEDAKIFATIEYELWAGYIMVSKTKTAVRIVKPLLLRKKKKKRKKKQKKEKKQKTPKHRPL